MEVHFMGKKGQTLKKYSAEFKLCVILDMLGHGLNYHETARKYWVDSTPNEIDGYRKNLRRWERIYLEEGAEGFMKERRGRGSKGRPRKALNKSAEEDLIAENQRLRMELEYLKKLSALVLAEEQEKNKKQ